MRQLWINTPADNHDRVADVVRKCAETTSSAGRMIVADVANEKVDSLLHDLEQFEAVELTYVPNSTVLIRSPVTDLGAHLRNITRVSVLETYVRAIQSISSWRASSSLRSRARR